ncbi:MAG: carboxymuconolactone decarboxylase family protein [Myxococcota bacterium]
MSKTKEEVLEQAKQTYGFVPNLMAEMAENPAVTAGFLAGTGALKDGVLTPTEQQVVMLAVSSHNECHYCSAAHRTAAKGMGVDREELVRIDDRELPKDTRLRALTDATWRVIDRRGWLEASDREAIEAAGIDRAQLYEIIAIVGFKTITNYINHIAGTEVDAVFQEEAKRKPKHAAA